MARRSERNKLRFQVEGAIKDIQSAQRRLCYMDSLADDRHPLIKEHTPVFVAALDEIEQALTSFRASL